MRKLIVLLLSAFLVFTLTACGEISHDNNSDETVRSTDSDNITSSADDNDLYDAIDNSNGLKMKMYGDYYFSKDGLIYEFFDGDVVLTYTTINDDDKIKNKPKNFEDFEIRFSLVFANRINAEKENFHLNFVQEKEINSFKVKEYVGSIIDDYDNTHNAKAYTFTCGINDCMVIAAPIDNTEEMTQKMIEDIDYFMNHLAVSK